MTSGGGQSLEDEMSRFEQEVLGSGTAPASSAPSFVIGAATFTSVQEQLSSLRAQVNAQRNVPSGHSIPGPGPNMGGPLQSMQPPAYNQNQNGIPTLSHPPRPPLVGFMPPQVRHQPPSTQANVRPLIHPPMPFIGAGPMQRPMAMPNTMAGPKPSQETLTGAPVRYTQPAVVMAPRVVYSSKPVLNKPTKQNHKPTEAAAGPVETRKREAEPAPSTSQPMAEEAKPDTQQSKKKKKKLDTRTLRTAAGEVWEDANLAEWDADDFRVFCGDLGNEVTDEKLQEAFKKYPSLQKCRVVRDHKTHKTKGYGFISFKDPVDYTRAMREMNGKYVGNRPIKLRKSTWKDRNADVVRKKEREKKRLGFR